MALFRMAFFRLFALIFRHFAWRTSFFRLFAWRYFVFSLFRLAFFRYFVFSLGVISSWRRAITPGEKSKERNNEMAQTSHHTYCLTEHQKLSYQRSLFPERGTRFLTMWYVRLANAQTSLRIRTD